MTTTTPRPPEGDWLGTPYLRFTRDGPFGVCTLDRPEARNAMTPAMYFGIRYAVRHVDAEPDLAGLLITGSGDVFAPGGDMGGGDRATFRVPELLRGIADTYYSQMLARLIGPVRTRDLMFTGRTLTAADAQEWGMVARVVPHDDLLDAARDVLSSCWRTAPAARSVVKSSLDNYLGLFD